MAELYNYGCSILSNSILLILSIISLALVARFVKNVQNNYYHFEYEGTDYFFESKITEITSSANSIIAFDVLILITTIYGTIIFVFKNFSIPKKYEIYIVVIILFLIGKIISSMVFVTGGSDSEFYDLVDNKIQEAESNFIVIPENVKAIAMARWEEVSSIILMLIFGILIVFFALRRIKEE